MRTRLHALVTGGVTAVALWGCDNRSLAPSAANTMEPTTAVNTSAIDPRELSAGTMTVFDRSSQAYTLPSPVTSRLSLFRRGEVQYETNRTPGDHAFGGLGPVYNNYSCNACHLNGGRTIPTLWTNAGSGRGGSSFLIFMSTFSGQPVPGYGAVLHDQAIPGARFEGRVGVTYTLETGRFDDGERYQLARPTYSFREWYTREAPRFVFSPRIPLRHVGLGLLLAVPDETIVNLATAQAAKSDDDITGRPQWLVSASGDRRVGHIDHKAESNDLTVEISYQSDLGVTNAVFPNEVYAEQKPAVPDDVLHHGPEVALEEMNALDYFLHTSGVPARRNVREVSVLRGERLFETAQCAICHVATLRTSPKTPRTIRGTLVPEVVNQEIHPYTDFLLHDMGPALADGRPSGVATGTEWRTTPLWGIGLQSTVSGHTAFMHDGRARSLMEAILWHDGEAAASVRKVKAMTRADRAALIKFLESL